MNQYTNRTVPGAVDIIGLVHATNTITVPVLVASQTGSNGINWWAMAAVSFAAILPLIIVAILLERFIVRGMSAGAVK